MSFEAQLLGDVERASATGSADYRAMLLRRITDLFIVESDHYSDEKIALFDDIIGRLALDIEISARALLALRLAPIPHAPPKTIRALAFDDAIEVARPVLTQSERLDEPTLVEAAKKKGQEHLLAISRRRSLSEAVTDVLVARGDHLVLLSTAENCGARFSQSGYTVLVRRAEGDDQLAACGGLRPDLPRQLLKVLLTTASERVRAKLAKERPDAPSQVRQAVDEATRRIEAEILDESAEPVEISAQVESLHRSGELNGNVVQAFADKRRFADVAAALALMCRLPVAFVAQALRQERIETVLILARSVGLPWSTVKAILTLRGPSEGAPAERLAKYLAGFERLSPAAAKEIVGFYRARENGKASRAHDAGRSVGARN
jgi:uncharacterized protein (DUF2336 family)